MPPLPLRSLEGRGWQFARGGLAYVLTINMQYTSAWCMYYCYHISTKGGNYIGIGMMVAILMIIFVLVIAGMIDWGIE